MKHIEFYYDEAAAYANLPSIMTTVDKGRAFGARATFCFQSLGQLKTCFPVDGGQTLLSNCTQVYVNVRDYPTAETVSNMLGDRTIVVDSGGSGDGRSDQTADQGRSHSTSHNNNYNWSQSAQRLLKPDQILNSLHPRWAICFSPGLPPILAWTQRYYEKDFNKTWSPWRVYIDACAWFVLAAFFAFLTTGVFLNR